MDKVFIYWDNSNIFFEAQRLAEERNTGPDARYRVRINFANMLRLAHADRPVEKARAAGSVPPEMRQLWNRLESQGVEVQLFDRGSAGAGEQEMPDRVLQLRMLEDGWDYNGNPGIAVMLTGDGAGYYGGRGILPDLGADARARLAGGDPVMGPFLQPADAPLGAGERRIRGPGRFLRLRYVLGAVSPRPPAGAIARFRAAGPVTASHGLISASPPGSGALLNR